MTIKSLETDILKLPVFDSHSHIHQNNAPLAAQNFLELGNYFWLAQQLQACGWDNHQELNPTNAEKYFAAFNKTSNTAMNWCLRQILKDLYGITISSPEDIIKADAIIKERANDSSHVPNACAKMNIKQIVQNVEEFADFPGLPGTGVLVCGEISNHIDSLLSSANPEQEREKTVQAIEDTINKLVAKGVPGVRLDYNLFETVQGKLWEDKVFNALLPLLEESNMFIQLFLGMVRAPGGSYPKNDTSRITDLYKFFRKYPKCRFELLSAADGNCMDVIQAAVGHKNVYVGGMWWYNFRPSMYKLSMQYRFEALAPKKCVLIASDATCIEWCYAKVFLVKKLLTEFLNKKVSNGWIDHAQAITIAKTWLYDAPAAYYL